MALGRGLWRSAGRSINRQEAIASSHTMGVAIAMTAHGSVDARPHDGLLDGERPDVDAVRRVAVPGQRPPMGGRA